MATTELNLYEGDDLIVHFASGQAPEPDAGDDDATDDPTSPIASDGGGEAVADAPDAGADPTEAADDPAVTDAPADDAAAPTAAEDAGDVAAAGDDSPPSPVAFG